jgi:hypothetical protein
LRHGPVVIRRRLHNRADAFQSEPDVFLAGFIKSICCCQNSSHSGEFGIKPLPSTERDSSNSIRRRMFARPVLQG